MDREELAEQLQAAQHELKRCHGVGQELERQVAQQQRKIEQLEIEKAEAERKATQSSSRQSVGDNVTSSDSNPDMRALLATVTQLLQIQLQSHQSGPSTT